MAAVDPAPAPSLDSSYLDQIPTSFPPARQRVYSQQDLEAFNLLSAPCWVFDIRHQAMWWANDPAVELWGAESLETLLKRDFAEGMNKASLNTLLHWLDKFHQGETIPNKWTFHPNQGRDGPKTCELKSSGIFVNSKTSTGEPTGEPWLCMLVVVQKVTEVGEERKEGEEDTLISKEQNANMIRRTEMMRNFPVIARLFNLEGGLLDQNPEAVSIFGSAPSGKIPLVSTAPVSSKIQQSLRALHPEDDTLSCSSSRTTSTSATANLSDFLAQFVDLEVGRHVWKEVTEGSECSTEALLYTGEGQSWFSVDVRETYDPITSAKVLIFSARDISKLMQYAKNQADKQNHSRNEFFAVMAHELRTPLHQIIGSMELLLRSKLDADQKENMQILQTSSTGMMAIINDALDFTKLEAGKVNLDQIQFQVPRVVDACVAAVQKPAEKKSLRIIPFVDEAIPVWLVGDPNRFRQVLLNLVSNAVKFSSNGTVEVRAKRIADDANNRVVLQFSVQDCGIGISKRKQALLFDAYQQADTSVSRAYGGTGLGLSICRSIVELMGGQIGVKSELKKGSTFWFEVPFQQYVPAARHEPQATTVDADNCYRILVVEDNKMNQKLVCKMLQRLGHTTTVAENGQVALDALEHQFLDASSSAADNEHEQYDLVLMDWQMPVMVRKIEDN